MITNTQKANFLKILKNEIAKLIKKSVEQYKKDYGDDYKEQNISLLPSEIKSIIFNAIDKSYYYFEPNSNQTDYLSLVNKYLLDKYLNEKTTYDALVKYAKSLFDGENINNN